MHDLDRAMFEMEQPGEYEAQGERADEVEREEFLGVLSGLLGGEVGGSAYEAQSDDRSRELELASELLEVTTEAELDRFIGNLLSRAAGAARGFAASDTGKALGGIIKHAAGQALPVLGKAIGGAVSPTAAGLGERVGRAAGAYFGLELEGLSGEDREFEISRALVRFAQEACRQALRPGPPLDVARSAAITAAQRYAPGLLPALQPAGGPGVPAPGAGRPSSGRWARQGDRIVIFDV